MTGPCEVCGANVTGGSEGYNKHLKWHEQQKQWMDGVDADMDLIASVLHLEEKR